MYGLPALGNPGELFALVTPFVLATSLLGQAVGARFRNPETPVILFIGLSIPLLFLVGFAWPREAIPKSVLAAGYVFPGDFAIDGLENSALSLSDLLHDFRTAADNIDSGPGQQGRHRA